MAEKGRTITGARARFMLNGKKVGYATGVRGGERIMYEPISALDNIQVEEHVPIGYEANLSANMVRIFGETLKSQGWFPQTGKSPEEHLQNILLLGDLVAVIIDTKNEKPWATFDQVKLSEQNFNVDARGVVGVDVSFVCVRAIDESEL